MLFNLPPSFWKKTWIQHQLHTKARPSNCSSQSNSSLFHFDLPCYLELTRICMPLNINIGTRKLARNLKTIPVSLLIPAWIEFSMDWGWIEQWGDCSKPCPCLDFGSNSPIHICIVRLPYSPGWCVHWKEASSAYFLPNKGYLLCDPSQLWTNTKNGVFVSHTVAHRVKDLK